MAASGEPVAGAGFDGAGVSTDGVAEQETFVGVGVEVDSADEVMATSKVCCKSGGTGGFDAEVHVRQERKAAKVDAWIPSCTARSIDGVGIVVRVGIGVEGDSLAKKRQAIAEVKVALPVAWVLAIPVGGAAVAGISSGGIEAEYVGFEAV